MLLKGSCHCEAVHFSVESEHPYPFNLCYCSICRKTAGAGGFAINLGGRFLSLKVDGVGHIRVYQARVGDTGDGPGLSPLERRFCGECGSMLWCWDPRWPDLVHPFASAIDTDLPMPPERTHLMLGSKAAWVVPQVEPNDKTFPEYPDESIGSGTNALRWFADGGNPARWRGAPSSPRAGGHDADTPASDHDLTATLGSPFSALAGLPRSSPVRP